MSRWTMNLGPLLLIALGSCFVSPGDCRNEGVKVEPCLLGARPGQTITLTASVEGSPSAQIGWELSDAVDAAFAKEVNGNRLTLISRQNSQGTFGITARSVANDALRGGAVISTNQAGYSSQPSPFQLIGGNFGIFGADVAAGGGVYYVAYADATASAVAPLGVGTVTNFFVKKFDLITNQLLAVVTGQFQGLGSNTIFPNIAADCLGRGYWVDDVYNERGDYALRRLSVGATTPDQPEYNFPGNIDPLVQTLAVTCNGTIYFIGVENNQLRRLYTIPAYGQAPIPVTLVGQNFSFNNPALAVDKEGRVLIGEGFPFTEPSLRRFNITGGSGTFTATVDAAWVPPITTDNGVKAIATDDSGVYYVVTRTLQFDVEGAAAGKGPQPLGSSGDAIRAINDLGDIVYSIQSYTRNCPSGCTASTCGQEVPFENIQSIAVSPTGGIRVIDDVFIPGTEPSACQETFRLVLINPQ